MDVGYTWLDKGELLTASAWLLSLHAAGEPHRSVDQQRLAVTLLERLQTLNDWNVD